MLDIDYTGLFSEENIEKFLQGKDYQENIVIWQKLYDHFKDYSPQKFNNEEIIDLKLLVSISLKYKYQISVVKELIYKMMSELQSIRFHLHKLYFKLLNSKEEKEAWLDECIEFYKATQSYQDICNFLEYFTKDAKGIDKSKYKEIYADTCMKIAHNTNGLIACSWYKLALPLYKQLGLKEKYNTALKDYNENIGFAQNDFQVVETTVEDEELHREAFKQTHIVYDFFKIHLKSIPEKINALCSIITFKNFGNFNYRYMPFFLKSENDMTEHSLIDCCQTITFSGNKIVKTLESANRYDWIGRELTREMQIKPAVQGILDSIKDRIQFEEEILRNPLITDCDQRHIKRALTAFLDEDYDVFIYIIIPNFEKLLRNVLMLNDIPDYTNKNTDTQVQTTLNLTETITAIKEHALLHPSLIEKISQELNEEDYENYRNKLSHREDDTIFTQKVAYDLFVLFIQLLKNFEHKGELALWTVTSTTESSTVLPTED